MHRVPAIGSAEIVRLINGPEAFTPDGEFILGESPEVRGFFVACGFCAHGIAGAGGMGRIMADWIVEGDPGLDVWHMDLRRFGAQYRSRRLTLERTHEVYRTYYDLRYPNQEREEGRRLRLSPAYPRLRELGASFGEKSGWERPNWFEPNAAAGNESRRPRGFAGPVLVAGDRGRARGDARARGALRRDVLLEARGGRPGRARSPPAALRQRRRQAGRLGRLHVHAQRARRHRVRLHGDAARADPVPHRHRHGVRHPRPRLHPAAPAGGRVGLAPRRHRGLLLHRPLGAARARHPRGDDDGRRVERRLSRTSRRGSCRSGASRRSRCA